MKLRFFLQLMATK